MTTIGKKVKNFKLPATSDKDINLKDLQGKKVVLYFYPKDCTSGCTIESQNFRDSKGKFTRQNTVIIGVSRDNLKSHDKFISKEKLNFDLIADEDEKLCEQFAVMKMKNMYGRKVRGIERSTFLLDEDGILRKEWRKVKIEGHVEEVLEAVKSI